MSSTFYDSPKDPSPCNGERHWLSIDVTHHWCWFFQHDDDEGDPTYVRVAKDELPAIYKALGEYLEAVGRYEADTKSGDYEEWAKRHFRPLTIAEATAMGKIMRHGGLKQP